MVPSSASINVAEQVNVVPVVTDVLGVMVINVETGGVLSIVTLVLEDIVAPLVSTTVAVQEMISDPLVTLALSCQVEPVLVAPELDDHV